MAHILAADAVLHRNTASYGSPTWDAMALVQDLTLNLTKDTVDVSTRGGGGWGEEVDGLKHATITFSMLYDTTDADFSAIESAFNANTAIEFLCLDGPAATSGKEGLRASCMVSGFTRNENLGEALTVDIELKPVKNADAAPAWYTVS